MRYALYSVPPAVVAYFDAIRPSATLAPEQRFKAIETLRHQSVYSRIPRRYKPGLSGMPYGRGARVGSPLTARSLRVARRFSAALAHSLESGSEGPLPLAVPKDWSFGFNRPALGQCAGRSPHPEPAGQRASVSERREPRLTDARVPATNGGSGLHGRVT